MKPYQWATDERTRAAIVADYLAGVVPTKLAEKYGVGKRTVHRYVMSAGHPLRPRAHPPKVPYEVLAADYATCRDPAAVAARHGVHFTVIRNAVLAVGQHYNTRRESQVKYPFIERAFAILTDEVAYWLGFLLADGCVSATSAGDERNCLQVALGRIDRSHLRLLLDFLGSSAPINDHDSRDQLGNVHPASSIRISSELLVCDLVRWGVTPRKSLAAVPHPDLCGSPHFWRGVVDGDGSVLWKKPRGGQRAMPLVALCGSRPVCDGFVRFVADRLPDLAREPHRSPGRSIWTVQWGGIGAKSIVAVLYAGRGPALLRKATAAQEFSGYTLKPVSDWSQVTRERLKQLVARLGRWGRVAAELGVALSTLKATRASRFGIRSDGSDGCVRRCGKPSSLDGMTEGDVAAIKAEVGGWRKVEKRLGVSVNTIKARFPALFPLSGVSKNLV